MIDSTVSRTTIPNERNRTPTVFKKIVLGTAIIFIIVVLITIFVNTNKPFRFAVGKVWTNYDEPKMVDLVIIIYSAAGRGHKRRAIRDTWLNSKNLARLNISVKYFFIVGNRDISNTKRMLLAKEADYDDIVTVPVFDGVQQSPWKLMETLKWINDQYLESFYFKYLLKCDDAAYVRIDKLAETLKDLEEKVLPGDSTKSTDQNAEIFWSMNIQSNAMDNGWKAPLDLYWGYFNGTSSPLNKYYDWILCDRFFPHAVADAYMLSNRLVGYLARNKNVFRYYSDEGVSLGMWLGGVDNVLRIHDRRFNPAQSCQNYLFILQNMPTMELRAIHDRINHPPPSSKSRNICNYNTNEEVGYNYNWSVPPSECCTSTG